MNPAHSKPESKQMPRTELRAPGNWGNPQNIRSGSYLCGYCGNRVASEKGYSSSTDAIFIALCPSCSLPTFFGVDYEGEQVRVPSNAPGNAAPNVPEALHRLYDEARRSAAAGAYTASVMASRKMLMNIAVTENAPAGKSFVEYVEYLADKGFVPPNGRVWVDYLRKKEMKPIT